MRTPRRSPALALALLALGAGPTAAQEVTVLGTVREDATGDALPGVLVLVDDGTRAATDSRGAFALTGVTPGRRDVVVVGRGCRLSSFSLEVGPAPRKQVDLRVNFGPVAFGRSHEAPPPEGRGTVVTADEIRGYGVATFTDLLRRVAPGLVGGGSGQAGGGRQITGRGGRTAWDARVPVVVVDGSMVPVEDTGTLDQIDPRDIAWLQILPGAIGGWRFGTHGSGGVIRVRTQSGVDVVPDDMDPEACLGR